MIGGLEVIQSGRFAEERAGGWNSSSTGIAGSAWEAGSVRDNCKVQARQLRMPGKPSALASQVWPSDY